MCVLSLGALVLSVGADAAKREELYFSHQMGFLARSFLDPGALPPTVGTDVHAANQAVTGYEEQNYDEEDHRTFRRLGFRGISLDGGELLAWQADLDLTSGGSVAGSLFETKEEEFFNTSKFPSQPGPPPRLTNATIEVCSLTPTVPLMHWFDATGWQETDYYLRRGTPFIVTDALKGLPMSVCTC